MGGGREGSPTVIEPWALLLRTGPGSPWKPRGGFSQLTPTYLLPLFSSHLPFLLFIGLVPYKYLLDTFWCVLGPEEGRTASECGLPLPTPSPHHTASTGVHISTKVQSPRDRMGQRSAGTRLPQVPRLTPGVPERCHGDCRG